MIEGVLYDANIILKSGDTKKAYKILRHKIIEIEMLDKREYNKVEW